MEIRYQPQRPLTGLQAAGLRSLWAGWLAMACGAFAGSSGNISEVVRHVVLVYPIGMHVWYIYLHSTFTIIINLMWVNIPYMDAMGPIC